MTEYISSVGNRKYAISDGKVSPTAVAETTRFTLLPEAEKALLVSEVLANEPLTFLMGVWFRLKSTGANKATAEKITDAVDPKQVEQIYFDNLPDWAVEAVQNEVIRTAPNPEAAKRYFGIPEAPTQLPLWKTLVEKGKSLVGA